MESQELHNRFEMQLKLPGFGIEAQHKLNQAKVLIIGAGGLGCPCILNLVAAGTGTVGICDGDTVAISNLHRQILFDSSDIGIKKVNVIKSRIQNIHPSSKIVTYDFYLNNKNALSLFPEYDLVIDCTDDSHTRLLINDACVLLQKPLVYGAVFQYEGQVAMFNTDKQCINLRDAFSENSLEEARTCIQNGALGAITGMIGNLQALETIKFICSLDGNLKNELLICNFLNYTQYKISVSKSKHNSLPPEQVSDFLIKNYRQKCLNDAVYSHDLDQAAFQQKINTGNVQVIDVRNKNEMPRIDFFEHENIPLQELLQFPEKIDSSKTILLFCHAGVRSQTAIDFLVETYNLTEVFHLKGGLLKWKLHE